jgi:hypothetical protein
MNKYKSTKWGKENIPQRRRFGGEKLKNSLG